MTQTTKENYRHVYNNWVGTKPTPLEIAQYFASNDLKGIIRHWEFISTDLRVDNGLDIIVAAEEIINQAIDSNEEPNQETNYSDWLDWVMKNN